MCVAVSCRRRSVSHCCSEHMVTEGERLDNITAQYLGDPEQFWRVCDANGAMRPDELTETIGRRLRITLPEGIRERQMLKGVHLTLMIGPVVPVPVPKPVLDALTSVEVTSCRRQSERFSAELSH